MASESKALSQAMEENIRITVIDRQGESHPLEAPTDMAMNIMELCKVYALPVKGTCGGMALCSSCHVYVESEHELPMAGTEEEDMLDQAFFVQRNSRLGCQLRITQSMDGLVLRLAPEDEEI
jgi:ferredoxin